MVGWQLGSFRARAQARIVLLPCLQPTSTVSLTHPLIMSTSLLTRSTLPLLTRSTPRLAITPKKATLFSLWVGPSSASSTPAPQPTSTSKLNRSFSSSTVTNQGAQPTSPSPEQQVQDSLKKDYISVYSKSWCPVSPEKRTPSWLILGWELIEATHLD